MDDEHDLDLIPHDVRRKLDRIGIKLHLKDWQAFSLAQRQWLRDLPCESDDERARYAAQLTDLVRRHTGRPPDRLKRTV